VSNTSHERDVAQSNQQFVIRAAGTYHETHEMISTYGTRSPRACSLPRERRSPAILPSRPFRSSRRTTNTTRRDFWTKCVRRTVVVWKETLRDPPRRAARMELKRVSCACFGGRSFAMSLLASLARMNGRMNAARSWILNYILVRRCS